jgi:hypothetical protein
MYTQYLPRCGPFLRKHFRSSNHQSACAFFIIPEMFGFPGPKEAAALRAERAAERVERGTTSVARALKSPQMQSIRQLIRVSALVRVLSLPFPASQRQVDPTKRR